MFEFKDISKEFKVDFWDKPSVVLNNINFKIEAGEIIGFLGANGAGKTTSLKILMGFISQTAGQVVFSEELGKTKKAIFNNIGFLPERPYFYPYLTGREYATYMGRLHSIKAALLEKSVADWFERMNLTHAIDLKVKSYSKGMLQRLGFICALLHNPKLIILDEPLSGLDPIGRKEFKDVLLELKQQGKTIFFSSHILSDVEEICERAVVLESGQLVYQGKIKDIIINNLKPEIEISVKGKLSSQYILKPKVEGDDFSTYIILNKNKKDFISEVLNANIEILKLSNNHPSLEEVIYKLKS